MSTAVTNNKLRLLDAWWRGELPSLVAIGLFFVIFFGWIWTNGIYLVGGDAFAYSYPLRTIAWGMIRQGELPLWTPSILSGYPLLSMAQLALGYPITWLYLFLPGHIAEEVFVLSPFLMAPLFTYAYAREIRLSRLAALLAALSYTYGGATIGLLGVVGMMSHSVLWLPLMLVALERARTRRFIPCLLVATIAFGLSVFSGCGQGFFLVGLVALFYATFLTLFVPTNRTKQDYSERTSDRIRPLAVCLLACTLGSGVAAWQILETLRATRRSIRSTLIYPLFVSGSFSPAVALKSFVAPLYTERFADVSTYVAPFVLLLATCACLSLRRHRNKIFQRDPRIIFWAVIALISAVLILGKFTPLYSLLYYVPIFNLFRVPSRHAFAWTFAASIMAGYGWDALRTARMQMLSESTRKNKARVLQIITVLLLILSVALGFGWARATGIKGLFTFNPGEGVPAAWVAGAWYTGLSMSRYLVWKATFTVVIIAALACAWQLLESRSRGLLLATALLLVCFVEPFIVVRNWWQPFPKVAARFHRPSISTSWLQANTASGARVYPLVDLFEDEFTDSPRVDPPNLTALYDLRSDAGYEPLLLQRYSRALGNVNLDAVSPLPGFSRIDEVFRPQSHVLDLLSTQFVLTYDRQGDDKRSDPTVDKEGIKFSAPELLVELDDGESTMLSGPREEGDKLALVTSLSNSTNIADGTAIAHVRVFTSNHRLIEFDLRAGVDTAEWAHERPDVRAEVKHKLAPVFDTTPLNDHGVNFPAHRFWTQLSLGTLSHVERIEIFTLNEHAPLAVWKATLFDSQNRMSYPLGHNPGDLLPRIDSKRWRKAFDNEGVFIFENQRALPHAWLVANALAVDGEEALRRISGNSPTQFVPASTALLEVQPQELPQLPSGSLDPASNVRMVSYEANGLALETNAPTSTVLVVSELFYPGWEASVDGKPVRILLTDYLLSGVALPPGKHHVEMRYSAPAARNGVIISAFVLFSLCLLTLYDRRHR
jgi:Bacterial membrane protein YfhO